MSQLCASVQEGTSLSGVSFPPPTHLITAPPVGRLLRFASLHSFSESPCSVCCVTLQSKRLLTNLKCKKAAYESSCVSQTKAEVERGPVCGDDSFSKWTCNGKLAFFSLGRIHTGEVLKFDFFGLDQKYII